MAEKWEKLLERWHAAGLLDAATAERIRAFEAQDDTGKLRWPVILAVSLGGILVAAGILLFVAAHWDDLSPAERFLSVLAMVGGFHVGGALFAERFPVMATALHAVGTAALGAGIFLAGQIFNLEEHWPGGVMMWAGGAWLAYWLKRDWAQASFVAILTPAWLVSEWALATEHHRAADGVAEQGLLLLAITYLAARSNEDSGTVRRALMWIGGIAILPLAVMTAESFFGYGRDAALPTHLAVMGWAVALLGPLALAYILRRRAAWINALWAVWVVVLGVSSRRASTGETLLKFIWEEIGLWIWCGLGAIGMIAWGLREARRERIDIGMAGFAITVMTFYFASVLDKLGRSMSLISAGVLFLVGGWLLERTRRRLIKKMEGAS